MPEFCTGIAGGSFGCLAAIAALVGGAAVMLVLARRAFRSGNRQDLLLIRQCAARGVDLRQPQTVEFLMYLDSEASANALAESLRAQGLEISTTSAQIQNARRGKASGDVHEGWIVRVHATQTLDAATATEWRKRLTPAAREHEGDYIGWQVRLQPASGAERT